MKKLLVWVLCCATLLLALLFIANTLDPKRQQKNFSTIGITAGSYTNCEVALSLMVEQNHTLSGALAPNTYGDVDQHEPCELLSGIYNNAAGEPLNVAADNTLRLRYIWGFRAVQGIAMSVFTINTAQKLTALLTLVSIALIGLLLYRRNVKSAFTIAPFLIGGAAFSGAFDTSALPISIAYLWAWVAGLILIKACDLNRDKEFSTVAGMISAFLWFMEGHFILLVTLIGLITFLVHSDFSVQRNKNLLAFKCAIRNIAYAHLGFLLLIALFVALKCAVFGLEPTLSSFSSAISNRSSSLDNSGLSISLQSIAHRLLFAGFQYTATYQSVWLWKTLLISTFIVFLGIVIYACINASRLQALTRHSGHYLLLLALVALYICIRLLAVPNHTYIHALLMSRYLIIPITSIWSFAIYLYLTQKRQTQPQLD